MAVNWASPSFQEKPLSKSQSVPVPETDTGGWEEHSKALRKLWLRNSAN